MFAFFLILVVLGALAVIVFSIGLLWLLLGERDDEVSESGAPLSLTQTIAREIEGRRVWQALSAWISSKPPRLEDRRDAKED